MKAYLLVLVLFFSSCDIFKEDTRIEVTYSLKSSDDSSKVDVLYLDKEGERITEEDLASGWRHSFRTEEGSQLLYIRLTNARQGSIRGRISVEGEVITDLLVREGGTKGISVWGIEKDIKIYYSINSGHGGYTTFSTPSGVDSVNVADFAMQEGLVHIEKREFVVDAGFEPSVSLIGEGIEEGDPCLFVRIEYEPVAGERLELISSERCSTGRTALNVSARVPGFSR